MALAYCRPRRPLQLAWMVVAAWRARTKARRCRCIRTAAWMTVAARVRRRCLASLRAAMPRAPACSEHKHLGSGADGSAANQDHHDATPCFP